MTEDELFDLLTSIEEMVPVADKPARLEVEAGRLEEGEHGRAQLLQAAGEHWQMRKDFSEARRCYEEAMADDGHTAVDIWASFLSLALDEGDDAEVARRDEELRVAVTLDALDPETCHFVGESYEVHGRLREAMRWFTLPLTWADDEDADDLCLAGRWRVRRELGLPLDHFDRLEEAGRAAS
jgi:hypothetical protein